jgi:hypothetical protein
MELYPESEIEEKSFSGTTWGMCDRRIFLDLLGFL